MLSAEFFHRIVSVNIFYKMYWFCIQTTKTLIRLHGSACWSCYLLSFCALETLFCGMSQIKFKVHWKFIFKNYLNIQSILSISDSYMISVMRCESHLVKMTCRTYDPCEKRALILYEGYKGLAEMLLTSTHNMF